MPFSGVSDPNLPSNVKKLSAKKKRQWIAAFNSTFRSCTGDDCEGKAFRVANGVVKKKEENLIPIKCECGEFVELEVGTEEATCGKCYRGMKMVWNSGHIEESAVGENEKHGYDYEISYYKPYGGATSFEEVDAFREAQDTSFAISSAKYMFDAIYDNIWEDKETSPSEKVNATETAMKEMVKRMQNPEDNKGFGDKIKSLIGLGKSSEEGLPFRTSLLTITKDTQGNLRWLALFTNKFEDREKEIFSEAAHKEYEAWVDENQRFPSLRIWHLPGTELGLADSVTYADGFMLATGTFYEKSLDVAEKLASMPDLGLSHGFAYMPEDLSDDGVYSHYRTFEISVLPMEHAANSWTAFTLESLQKEVAMGLDTKKRPFFVDLLGEERVTAFEATLPQISKDLQQAGVAWKDLTEALASDEDNSDEDSDGEGGGENKGDEENSGGDGKDDGTEDPKETDNTAPAELVAKSLEGFKATLDTVITSIASLKEEVAEIKKTDDEKIADRMQQAKVANGNRPSNSQDNVIDPEQTKDLDRSDEDQKVGGNTQAAQDIVDELLLGKKKSAVAE